MKRSLRQTVRQTLAVAVGTLALAVGLGVPTATPASAAANCTSITSIRGSADYTSTTTRGTTTDGQTFSNVSLKTPGYCGSSSRRYVLTASWSQGGGTALSSTTSYDLTQDYTVVRFPTLFVDTPAGTGSMTLEVTPQTYTGSFWISSETSSFRINVPSDFDSATGQGMSTSGYCGIPPGTSGVTSKWC